MKKLYRHYAEVTSMDDPGQKGKIQVRLLPEMRSIHKSLLPWATPFINTGFSNTSYSLSTPKIGSKIYVLADINMRYFHYVNGVYIEGIFNYTGVKSSLDTISEMSNTVYPNVDFILLEDGSIKFHNKISGDHGFLHNTGTYYIVDTNGYVFISEASGNKISMNDSGMILADKNGNDIVMGSSSVMINGNLEIL